MIKSCESERAGMLVPILQTRKWKPHVVVICLRLQFVELFLELR